MNFRACLNCRGGARFSPRRSFAALRKSSGQGFWPLLVALQRRQKNLCLEARRLREECRGRKKCNGRPPLFGLAQSPRRLFGLVLACGYSSAIRSAYARTVRHKHDLSQPVTPFGSSLYIGLPSSYIRLQCIGFTRQCWPISKPKLIEAIPPSPL